jgi:hypothetical protein
MRKLQPDRDWDAIPPPLDSPTAQVIGGGLSAVPGLAVPGGSVITQTLIDTGIVPKGTREAQLGKGIVEIVGGVGTAFIGVDAAIVGGGMTLTGPGAVVGVPVCAGGIALATNGLVSFCNGVKTVAIVLCNWENEAQPLYSTALKNPDSAQAPASTAPTPAAKPTEPTPAPAKPAAAAPAKPAPAKPAAAASAKPAPAKPAVVTSTTTQVKPAKLEPYKDGGGHHVPAKRAFEGAPGYDPKKALAIPKAELKGVGVQSHGKVTGAQLTRYKAFAETGQPLTWEVMAKIETEALVDGGMNLDMAKATVTKAIQALKDGGVAAPIRIPWGK